MEKRKELKKLNNGGFSLVELIIVIAIMAILVGVLAPQYMRYVGRSRIASDQQNATAIVSAIQIYASDPQATIPLADGDNIVISPNGGGSVVTGNGLAQAFTDAAINVANISLQSNTWNNGVGGAVTITVNIDANNNITVTSSDPAILQPQGGAAPDAP